MRELTLDKLPKRVLRRLDMETAFKASRCVLAAEKLLVFRTLDSRKMSARDVSRRTGINPTYCEPFLDFLVFLGLLRKQRGLYGNTPLATRHFIRGRSIDWTRLWPPECIRDYEALTVLEDVITGRQTWREITGKTRKPDYELAQEDRQWASDFTYALYDLYRPNADLLAAHLDLSRYHTLLDVGGGSGVMSFALVRAFPHLTACILDFPFVCDAANEIIRKERLTRRVKTLAGDMNKGLPSGFDVIMFWNIGYVEPGVIAMAYERLPEGGMIVRDCSVPSRSRAGSPSAFLHKYLAVRPKQESKDSMIESIQASGFRSIRYRRLSSSIGLIVGFKGKARR